MVTKSNAQKHGMVMWDEIAAEVAAEFPDVSWDKMLVDAMTVRMTLDPQVWILLWQPIFMQISCRIWPVLLPESSVAPTANIDPERTFPSMFEPIHGSAFDIVGKGIANPVASFWSASQMLNHLGEFKAADLLMSAIESATGDGYLTPDVGGTSRTADVTGAVISAIRAQAL